MEKTGEALKEILSLYDILLIHHAQITEFENRLSSEDKPGLDKNILINPDSLEFVLAEIRGLVFPYNQYPTIIEKTAILAWRIIERHVFVDGNKRTGMAACYLLLELNGYKLTVDNEDTKNMALNIADSKIEFSGFVNWLKTKVSKSKDT